MIVRVLRDKYDPTIVSADFDAVYQQLAQPRRSREGKRKGS